MEIKRQFEKLLLRYFLELRLFFLVMLSFSLLSVNVNFRMVLALYLAVSLWRRCKPGNRLEATFNWNKHRMQQKFQRQKETRQVVAYRLRNS